MLALLLAAELVVEAGGSIQAAIDAAMPGDVVTVRAGTYVEALHKVLGGTASLPITIRADGGATVVVTVADRVLRVSHPYLVCEGLVLDAQDADADSVQVEDSGDFLVLRGVEVRRAARDCVDLGGPEDVLVADRHIHHYLNAAGGRTDAHGIVAGPVRRLTIRGTEIHSFSGDAVQLDPGRSEPAWDELLIEGSRFWLEPLPAPENGFAAGVVPGENAFDSKTPATGARSGLVVRDTAAFGFRSGLIGDMAAFNIVAVALVAAVRGRHSGPSQAVEARR